MTKQTYQARETWLARGTVELARRVFAPKGYDVPADVKVSCSWPGGGSARKRIGECWPRSFSGAKINEVFISPVVAEPVAALDILAHELVHAIDDCASGHKKVFGKIARGIGLEGKLTATHAGPELKATLVAIAEALGPYPHSTLNLSRRKKQTTRNIKVECRECGCTFRMAQKWIDEADELACPACHSHRVEVAS